MGFDSPSWLRNLWGDSDEDRVWNHGNAQRDVLYAERDLVTSQYQPNYAPKAVAEPDDFESMDYATMAAHVQSMNPELVEGIADGWRSLARRIGDGWREFDSAIRAAGAEWQGLSKDAATAAAQRYVQNAEQLQGAVQLTANKVDEMNTGMRQVKSLIPEVPATGGFWSSGMDAMVAAEGFGTPDSREQARLDEAEAEARRVLTLVYTPVVRQADDQVPILPPPPAPPGLPEQAGSPGGGFGGGGSGGGGGYGGRPGGGVPGGGTSAPFVGAPTTGVGVDNYAVADRGAAAEADRSGGSLGLGESAPTSGRGLPDAGSQTVAASASPLSGLSGGAAGLGGSSGGFGGGAGGGIGAGIGGPLTAGPSVVAGAPGVVSSGAAGAAAGAAGARAGGMMPMGAAGGARGGGSDDKEHKTPGYLINMDNGNELIGTLDGVAPPVIGADPS